MHMYIYPEFQKNSDNASFYKKDLSVMFSSILKNIVKGPKLIFNFYKDVYLQNAEFKYKGSAFRNFNGF